MKITNINLLTYENINSLRPNLAKNDRSAQNGNPESSLKGASFAELLSYKEIDYLRAHFMEKHAEDMVDMSNTKTQSGNRIDVLA